MYYHTLCCGNNAYSTFQTYPPVSVASTHHLKHKLILSVYDLIECPTCADCLGMNSMWNIFRPCAYLWFIIGIPLVKSQTMRSNEFLFDGLVSVDKHTQFLWPPANQTCIDVGAMWKACTRAICACYAAAPVLVCLFLVHRHERCLLWISVLVDFVCRVPVGTCVLLSIYHWPTADTKQHCRRNRHRKWVCVCRSQATMC